MANATSPSEDRLERAARTLGDAYGIPLRLTRIVGVRWEYLAGSRDDAPSGPLDRVRLTDAIGLVAPLGELEPDARDRLIRELTSAVAERVERDSIGERTIPAGALWGIHTLRARENFGPGVRPVHPALLRAYGQVKLACATANSSLGFLDDARFAAISAAAGEMASGALAEHVGLDAFQGGAGTSTNLAVCEVIANRAMQLAPSVRIDPVEHVNLHQSTNDTYPTALRVAVFGGLKVLEGRINALQEVCQDKEREFAGLVRIGRTELTEAVPVTLGRAFGAWADALARDRWRVYKCTERIRVVNLGGTAVGTGLGAPRDYIFLAAEILRDITGLPLARAENLFEATQNADVFVEVSGILKAHAANLMKISGDLRLMAAFGEIALPALQAGSSIMPGKVNPVVPEAMAQAAIQTTANDTAIAMAAGAGQLELNAFLPLIAANLLETLDLLAGADLMAAERCVRGISANPERCRAGAWSSPAVAAVLLPLVGYNRACEVARAMRELGLDLSAAAERIAGIPPETTRSLLEPGAVDALGFVDNRKDADTRESEGRRA